MPQIRLVALFALTAFVAVPPARAEGDPPCNPFVAHQEYEHCIDTEAERLERSGESASDVAVAALDACYQARNKLFIANQTCHVSDTIDAWDRSEAALKQHAIAKVVELRLKQHTARP